MVDKKGELKIKNFFLNQRGQAVFEMILFLPILMFLYTIYYTVGNAISGSINQQKAVRGYYYARMKGNSYVETSNELKYLHSRGIGRVGFSALGWAQRTDKNGPPYAPCFSFSSLLKNNSGETCDGKDRDSPDSSRFIRLFTVYGVCGASYSVDPNDPQEFIIEPSGQALGSASCIHGKE
jgi:hypothetical protein